MSKVVSFYQTGGPEVLQVEQHDIGEPAAGEVKIRIEAIGLNRAEAMFRSGKYLESPALPAPIGYEAAAVIEAVGSDTCAFKPGDKVSVIPAFSMNKYGTYAEVALVPVSAVVKWPANLSAEQAAAVWMQYLTAWGALIDLGHLT